MVLINFGNHEPLSFDEELFFPIDSSIEKKRRGEKKRVTKMFCKFIDYRNPDENVHNFLVKVGNYMVNKVADFFVEIADIKDSRNDSKSAKKVYETTCKKATLFLKKICNKLYLPVPDINMTFEEMKSLGQENDFVEGFIAKYYENDFCLVGDTQQVKRFHKHLNFLESQCNMSHKLVDISGNFEKIKSYRFESELMSYCHNYETAIITYPIGIDLRDMYASLLKLNYTLTIIQCMDVKYFFVVNVEDDSDFKNNLDVFIDCYELSKYFMAKPDGHYIRTLKDNADDQMELSGFYLNEMGKCSLLVDRKEYFFEWVRNLGGFRNLKKMLPRNLVQKQHFRRGNRYTIY